MMVSFTRLAKTSALPCLRIQRDSYSKLRQEGPVAKSLADGCEIDRESAVASLHERSHESVDLLHIFRFHSRGPVLNQRLERGQVAREHGRDLRAQRGVTQQDPACCRGVDVEEVDIAFSGGALEHHL